MPVLAVDEVALREPRLLVPRRAPVGPVRLDTAHPMAQRIAWIYGLFQGGWPVPLGGNRAIRLTPVTALPKTNTNGLGRVATTRLSLNNLSGGGGIITSDGGGTGDYAILVHAAPTSSTTSQLLFHQRYNAAPYNTALFRANGYYDTGSGTTTASAGTIYFGTYSETVAGRGVWVTSRANGLPHCWLGVRRGGVFELYEDGVLLATDDQSANVADVYNVSGAFALGGWTVLDTLPATDPMHLVAGWDYAPPQAMCAELSRDPYSLLIPA